MNVFGRILVLPQPACRCTIIFAAPPHASHKKLLLLLLMQDGAAKIGDVGMAQIMTEGYLTKDNALGTLAWAAPELLLGEKCVSTNNLKAVLYPSAASCVMSPKRLSRSCIRNCCQTAPEACACIPRGLQSTPSTAPPSGGIC